MYYMHEIWNNSYLLNVNASLSITNLIISPIIIALVLKESFDECYIKKEKNITNKKSTKQGKLACVRRSLHRSRDMEGCKTCRFTENTIQPGFTPFKSASLSGTIWLPQHWKAWREVSKSLQKPTKSSLKRSSTKKPNGRFVKVMDVWHTRSDTRVSIDVPKRLRSCSGAIFLTIKFFSSQNDAHTF